MKLNYSLLLIFLILTCVNTQAASINGTMMVEMQNGEYIYISGKKTIPNDALLEHFGDLIKNECRRAEVVIYFTGDVTFDVILNLKGIITKAGTGNIKYYYFDNNLRKTFEVKIDTPVLDMPEKLAD